MVIVLADGLGSGVKASILSTLTSKIISTMMAQEMSIEDCVSTIASTLPVCKVREVAYSTFTIVRIVNHEDAEIIQYDNPHVILPVTGKISITLKLHRRLAEKPSTSQKCICRKTIFFYSDERRRDPCGCGADPELRLGARQYY